MSSKEIKEKNSNNNVEEKNPLIDSNKKEEISIITMKKGDYSVHVLIEEVKNLISKEENIPQPIIKVKVNNQIQRTKNIPEKVSSYLIGEHMYYDFPNMTNEILDSSKIIIEVSDKNYSNREDYIGIYEFDFMFVYNNPKHSLHNYWIALANPESDDFKKIRGYIRISASVLHESDDRVELTCTSKDNNSNAIALPPQIKIEYYQIKIDILKADGVPDMDSVFGVNKNKQECDGYIKALYMGNTVKTSVQEMKSNLLVWNETIYLPVSYPVVSNKICLSLWDKDAGSSDDIIGSFEIDINNILSKKYEEFRYVNIYGAPLETTGEAADKMNENSEIGSLWKGKILLRAEAKKTEFPKTSCEKIPENSSVLQKAGALHSNNYWNLEIKLESAMFLPYEEENYLIKFCIQKETVVFGPVKSINGFCKFNKTNYLSISTLSPEVFDLGNLVVYLIKGSKDTEKNRICFQKLDIDLFDKNNDYFVIKLLPDPVIGNVKMLSEAGLIKFKIKLGKPSNKRTIVPNNELNSISSINKDVKKSKEKEEDNEDEDDDDPDALFSKKIQKKSAHSPIKKNINAPIIINNTESSATTPKYSNTILVNLHQSRNLIAGDDSGLSDPYVQIKIGKFKKNSTVKYETINGTWNEVIEFNNVDYDVNDTSTWPIVFFQVYDKDTISSDDSLGFSYVWITDSRHKINDLSSIIPQWINLHLPLSNKKQGQLLVSFTLIDNYRSDLTNKIKDINIYPSTEMYSFEINILGLRSLQHKGILPIKKPFISFDLNSIACASDPGNNVDLSTLTKEQKAIELQNRKDRKKATQLQPIKTEPKQTGVNPTINTIIKFNAYLPKDRIFIPNMLCFVYDYILAGICNSLLGAFEINIPKIEQITNNQLSTDLRYAKKKLAQLRVGNSIVNNALKAIEEEEKKAQEEIALAIKKEEEMKIKEFGEKALVNAIELAKEKSNKNNYQITANSDKPNIEDKELDVEEIKLEHNNTLKKDLDTNENTKQRNSFFNKLKENKNSEGGLSNNSSLINNKLVSIKNNQSMPVINPKKDFVVLPQYSKFTVPSNKREVVEVNEKDPNTGKVKKVLKKQKITYYLIEDEAKYPDPELYMSIGYQKVTVLKDNQTVEEAAKEKNDKYKRHFRRVYHCPLEDEKSGLGISSPFIKIPIQSGAYEDKADSNLIFTALADKNNKILKNYKLEAINNNNNKEFVANTTIESCVSSQGEFKSSDCIENNVGYFKGLIKIGKKNIIDNIQQNISTILSHNPEIKYLSKYEELSKRLLSQQEVIIRIYVLDLRQLAKKDVCSESDPYIKIICGDKVIDDSKSYINDSKDASIRKCYEIVTTLPGVSDLKIQVWDYDPLFSDELIGETIIDIEDRYYDPKWEDMQEKPIETRPLLHPDYNMSQGYISMWLEIINKSSNKNNVPKYDISLPSTNEAELRVIIWETRDIPMMDVEGTCDMYINAFVEANDKRSTDIHFRCQTGIGSFNWRMLFPVELPRDNKNNTLNIQVYDKDLFSKDDFTCNAEINLEDYFKLVYQLDTGVKFSEDYFTSLDENQQDKMFGISSNTSENKKYYPEWYKEDDQDKKNKNNKFWLPMKRPNEDGVNIDRCGEVLVSIELLPKWKADISKVGSGRDEPNVNPYLPPPIGRFEWSMNPFKMFNQCIGPKYRKKVYQLICALFCIVWCLFLIPYIFLHLASEISNPYNYIK